MLGRTGLGDLLDLPPLAQGELRRAAALYFGYSELNPSALKLRITSRTRSSLVKATFAIAAASMPCADSSTICARRRVTSDPLPRRTIRTSRRPSSSSIPRTRRADFDTLYHPRAVDRENRVQPPSSRVPGPAGFYSTALWLRAGFADLRYDIHHAIADGDLVAVNSTMNATPMAFYTDDGAVNTVFPPTGNTFAMTQSHWFRIDDGQIIEHWANRDDLGTARKLAWIPPTPAYLLKMARAKRRAKRS